MRKINLPELLPNQTGDDLKAPGYKDPGIKLIGVSIKWRQSAVDPG